MSIRETIFGSVATEYLHERNGVLEGTVHITRES
jgi:hypothetical protein